MKDIVDLHTHTIASGHAYSTIKEMAEEAAKKGVMLLGITEHSITMPGTCHEYYFQNMRILNRSMCGIEILFGTELNVVDYDGKVDMKEETMRQMDICIASLHIPCIKPGTIKENTNAAICAMKNPYVTVIGHPDDARYPLDYKALVRAAKETNTLLEINNSSLSPTSFRQHAKENVQEMLKLCEEYEVSVVVDSDAHAAFQVGCHKEAFSVLEEIKFPEELIMNDKPEKIKRLILSKRSGL